MISVIGFEFFLQKAMNRENDHISTYYCPLVDYKILQSLSTLCMEYVYCIFCEYFFMYTILVTIFVMLRWLIIKFGHFYWVYAWNIYIVFFVDISFMYTTLNIIFVMLSWFILEMHVKFISQRRKLQRINISAHIC